MAGASFDTKEVQSSLPMVRCRSDSLPSLRSEMSFLSVTGQGIGESPLMKKRGSTPYLHQGSEDAAAPPLTEDAQAMGEEWLKFLHKAKQTASWTAELRKRTTQWHRMFNINYRPKPRADDNLGLYGQSLWVGNPHDGRKHGRMSKSPSPSRSEREPIPKKPREATTAGNAPSSYDHCKRGRDPKQSSSSSQREAKSPKKMTAFSSGPSRSLEVTGSSMLVPVKRSQSHPEDGSGVVVVVEQAPVEMRVDETESGFAVHGKPTGK